MVATIIAFSLYLIAVVVVGIRAARKSQSTASEVHLGNREHGTWTSALSSSASTESGFVLLGMVGMGYSVGANCFWIVPAGIIGYLINWLLLGPQIRRKSEELDVVTIPEFISAVTGHTAVSKLAACLASLCAIVFLIAYVAAQFSAAGKALSTQFGTTFAFGLLIGAGIVALYAILGGFRAVSWTDNLQAVMMVIALIILPAVVVSKVGGLTAMFEQLRSIDPTLVSFSAGTSGVSAVMAALPWLMLGLAYPGQPHAVARLMATRDERSFQPGAVVAVIWFTVVYSGAVLLGMAARAGFADVGAIQKDPETTLPTLAVDFLPGILAGTVLAAVLAAISSTADSTLLSAATTVVRDARAALGLQPAQNELRATRVVIIVLTLISIVFAFQNTSVVFTLVLYAWSGLGASLGPTVLYCSLAKKPKALPALFGLVVGASLAFALHSFSLNLLLAFSGSIMAIVLGHVSVSLIVRNDEPSLGGEDEP